MIYKMKKCNNVQDGNKLKISEVFAIKHQDNGPRNHAKWRIVLLITTKVKYIYRNGTN